MVRENVWEKDRSGNAHHPEVESGYLFYHSAQFKLVRVGQAANKASFPCPVDPHAFSFGTTEGGGLVSARLWMVIARAWVGWTVTRFRAQDGPTFLCFSVEKEIAQDPTGTPIEAIGPTLDAALCLVEDEDGARSDHPSFRLD